VKEYLDHLDHLDMMNEKIKTERKKKNLQENSMTCEKFDWKQMLNNIIIIICISIAPFPIAQWRFTVFRNFNIFTSIHLKI
jgi:hypothetical protein